MWIWQLAVLIHILSESCSIVLGRGKATTSSGVGGCGWGCWEEGSSHRLAPNSAAIDKTQIFQWDTSSCLVFIVIVVFTRSHITGCQCVGGA